MNRTVSRLCSAALVASGILVGSARCASAQADVSNDTIRCGTVTGTISFRPSLVFQSVIRAPQDAAVPATSVAMKIKGKLSGCADLTNPFVLIDSGSFQGMLVGTTNDCMALTTTQPAVGSLVYRWKANAETPILQSSSSQSVTTLTGASFVPTTLNSAFSGSTYIMFRLGTGTVTGAFTGIDAGAASANVLVTNESNRFFGRSCTPPASLKKVHFGIGAITLR